MITNKIKEMRKIKKLTQDDLAEYLGITRKTMNQIENGNVMPKIDLVYKLSIILETTIEQLFYNEEYNKHYIKHQEESIEKITSVYFNMK